MTDPREDSELLIFITAAGEIVIAHQREAGRAMSPISVPASEAQR